MILCDMGAEVCKIEPVGMTEEERGPGPMKDGVNTYFFSINRGKQSVLIDLKTDEGRELALSLAEKADILTENFTPGTMARLGLGYEAVAARNPRIIYASTSGFGQPTADGQAGSAPARGAVDVIVQAMSGLMSITGHADGPPSRAGYSIGDMAAGMFTAIGILGAVHERERSGLGQRLDVSMFDAQLALLENAFTRYFATGDLPQRLGTRHPLITPFQAFPSADGYIVIANVKDWALFCALLDLDALATDTRFETNALRTQNHAALEPLLSAALRQDTTAAWLEKLGVACLVAPLNTIAEAAVDPVARARGMFAEVEPQSAGAGTELPTVTVMGSPLKYSRTPVVVARGADAVAGHTADVLRRWLGMSDAEIEALAAAGVVQT
jgi:CoA:oxalate CoA-transferase